jgi:hypothetical protein
LAASQGVAELVQKDDCEERKVLEGTPDKGAVAALTAADFDDGYNKPGPVKVEIDTRNAAEMDGTLTQEGHSN